MKGGKRWRTPQREAVVLGLIVLIALVAAMLSHGFVLTGNHSYMGTVRCTFSFQTGLDCKPLPAPSREAK